VYLTGNALVILDRPDHLLQTIYHEEVLTLDAVTIDEETGKIAACSEKLVFIYKPYEYEEGVYKWSLQSSIVNHCEDDDAVRALSWGTSEELLVGSKILRLYQTEDENEVLWEKRLANAVDRAEFSPDADLIASTARYDRLVKIWRRLAFGSDEVQFDFSYIAHPKIVTGLQWRDTKEKKEEQQHVLYTICEDQKVRVWAAMDPHGMQVLQLWAEIDMQDSIQPRYLKPGTITEDRFVFFMPAREFKSTVTNALGHHPSPADQPILEHLLDIAGQGPDICVIMDSKGHMCAWGMQNLGGKKKAPTDVFNIALVENFDIFMLQADDKDQAFANVINFHSEEHASKHCVLVHRLGGGIAWLEGGVDEFFDVKPGRSRLQARALWTGHEGSVKKIVRTAGGRAIISRTNDNEASVWKQVDRAEGQVLVQSSTLCDDEHIHRSLLLNGGRYVANLHHERISLWDTMDPKAEVLATCAYKLKRKALCLIQLPRPQETPNGRFLATISSGLEGIVWQVHLPSSASFDGESDANKPTLEQFCTFKLGLNEPLSYVLPIDPARSKPIVEGLLDVFAKDCALSYTSKGVVTTWTAKIDLEKRKVSWLATATVSTSVEYPTMASGSSIRKIALVNSSRDALTIWYTRSCKLEYERQYDQSETVQDLDWTSTPDDQSVLAVGFPHKVVILAQIRYDYLDKGAAWSPIREINIREMTPHPIGDSTWMGNGNLVIGAGTQLFMYDKLVSSKDEMINDLLVATHMPNRVDLFDVVSVLNGPLPIYHPQLLAQCVLAGKLDMVQKVLSRLHKVLRFYSDGDEIESTLGIAQEELYLAQQDRQSNTISRRTTTDTDEDQDDESCTITEDVAKTLIQNLVNKSVPYLSSREQAHLADLVECVATAERQRRSMDDNATRFLHLFRQHMLRQEQEPQRQSSMSWREFAWAYHSGSQDVLVNIVSRHFSGRMLWKDARESGMFMWMTDITALRAQFEIVGRNEYTKTDEKNPVDCSLYFLALKKKNVLSGLWRMATWHREQAGTRKMLSNNFDESRWQTAALKNAYALLGKRRFEYAASFFLLANHLQDAVSVLAGQMDDLQLAIAVARVYDGDESPVLRSLLEDKVLPRAASEGNRWMASWAFWMLGRRDMALRALIVSQP
jgi:hypothetical protein